MTTMTAAQDLRREIEAARVLLANYRDILGEDAEAQADAVEGETNLHEAIRPALARIAEIEAMCEGLTAAMDRLKARRSRLEQQGETLRTLLLAGMEMAGLKKVETDLATVSRKPVPPSVQITNEAEIPAAFWKRGDPKLDKKALLAALKEADEQGTKIPGAELSNGGETISVRFL